MRGYRPSYFSVRGEDDADDFERTKQDNVLRYMERVQAGLPLFEEDGPKYVAHTGADALAPAPQGTF